MFANNKISDGQLMGAAFKVSRNVDISPIAEGIQVTFSSVDDANSLLAALNDQGVKARRSGNSVIVPYDSLESEDFGE